MHDNVIVNPEFSVDQANVMSMRAYFDRINSLNFALKHGAVGLVNEIIQLS